MKKSKQINISQIYHSLNKKQDELDASIHEVLEGVNNFASFVEKRFDKLETEILLMKSNDAAMKTEISAVRNLMADKYFMEKIFLDINGKAVGMVKGGDAKTNKVIKTLEVKKVFTRPESNKLMDISPFASIKI